MFSNRKASNFLHDVTKMAGAAVSLTSQLKEEIKRDVESRFDALVTKLDLVPRKDFEALEALVTQLRIEQDLLKQGLQQPPSATSTKKTRKPVQ